MGSGRDRGTKWPHWAATHRSELGLPTTLAGHSLAAWYAAATTEFEMTAEHSGQEASPKGFGLSQSARQSHECDGLSQLAHQRAVEGAELDCRGPAARPGSGVEM